MTQFETFKADNNNMLMRKLSSPTAHVSMGSSYSCRYALGISRKVIINAHINDDMRFRRTEQA